MRGGKRNMLALLTVASMGLAACGGEQAENGDTTGQAPAAGSEAPAAAPPPQQQQATLAAGVTQEQFDQGQQLFTGQGACQACHGPQATGTQLGPDLTDSEWLNITDPSVEQIVTLIKTGVVQPKEHPAPMPPMGGANLTDEQVEALAGYVLSIAGE